MFPPAVAFDFNTTTFGGDVVVIIFRFTSFNETIQTTRAIIQSYVRCIFF